MYDIPEHMAKKRTLILFTTIFHSHVFPSFIFFYCMSYSLYFYDFFIHKFYEKFHFHRLLLIDKYDLNLKIIIIKACALPSSSMRILQC